MSHPSPWPGSEYRTRHRWQLEQATSLADVATTVRELAAELSAAHAAGWWLVEPMRSGHLQAARPSRRQRARPGAVSPAPSRPRPSPVPGRRLRVVDEPARLGQERFDAETAVRTPVLAWTGRSFRQVGGSAVAPDILADAAAQVAPGGLANRLWGYVAARTGPSFDLVAQGSGLRLHTVREGALVRTVEVLTFQHAADGAGDLAQAAHAYAELAREAEAMAAGGGWLIGVDDGFAHVAYGRSVA